jgi:carbon-monoxide dehydrogenase medium subunit
VKAAAFRYRRPGSVAQALEWLRDDDEAKILAGGQSLVPLMNLRLARPETLIDATALPELERIIPDARSLLLGALVRHRTLERHPQVAERIPLLAEAARHIGHIGIRNRGTVGGSLCHADPAAEIPLVAAVLGATVYLESAGSGRRAVLAREFCTGFFSTVVEADELLTWVRMPALAAGEGWGFVEIARRHGDFALAGAAVTIRLDASGAVESARAGVLAVSDTPVVLDTGELAGRLPTESVLREWAHSVTAALRPAEDPEFRRGLAGTVLYRAMGQAVARCRKVRGG